MNSSYFDSNKPQSLNEVTFMHPDYYDLPPTGDQVKQHSVQGWYELQGQLEKMIASEHNSGPAPAITFQLPADLRTDAWVNQLGQARRKLAQQILEMT